MAYADLNYYTIFLRREQAELPNTKTARETAVNPTRSQLGSIDQTPKSKDEAKLQGSSCIHLVKGVAFI
jgi:hypothetical protein